MEKNYPSSTKVVVIGGGVAGTSCAYHLAKFGWKDVVLLERDQLTSGTTWHAAGLMGQLGATSTITKLRKYSLDLYKELEKTTGFNFKGDLQIHYSQGKKGAGVYYTIGNRDQEGLSAREMFLNRLDYYDGKDQSTQDGGKVYRKFFQPTKEGLEAMYESI